MAIHVGRRSSGIRTAAFSHPTLFRALLGFVSTVCVCLQVYYAGLGSYGHTLSAPADWGEGRPLLGSYFFQGESSQEAEEDDDNDMSISSVSFRPYHELADEIESMTLNVQRNSETSFSRADVKSKRKRKRSWFQPTTNCTETCCVHTVAISMHNMHREQSPQLLNTEDGLDLADITFQDNPVPAHLHHLEFLANSFHEDMIPCIQPGTIFYMPPHVQIQEYFWKKIRPQIHVPFTVMTSNSDTNSPFGQQYIKLLESGGDPLLIRWYGMNPLLPGHNTTNTPKFLPMALGLSMNHPQSKYLTPYLELTNKANPFADMSRFRFTKEQPVDWDRDVLVFFGRDQYKTHRIPLWENFCGTTAFTTTTTTTNKDEKNDHHASDIRLSLSCLDITHSLSPHQIYTEASHYKFGISPPGHGWDCYRTYEYLYLGIIPIIEERAPYSQLLFEGLPVIHFPNLSHPNTTKADIMKAIQDYVNNLDFGNSHNSNKAATQEGWDRLFLPYWRRKMLQEANRTTIFNKDGDEYYVGYRYESTNPANRKPLYCNEPGNCEV